MNSSRYFFRFASVADHPSSPWSQPLDSTRQDDMQDTLDVQCVDAILRTVSFCIKHEERRREDIAKNINFFASLAASVARRDGS